MTSYAYSLSKHRPELYKNCLLPLEDPVPVSYEGAVLPPATIDSAGEIRMDLPDDLIKRIESGHVLVMIYNASLPPHQESDPRQIFRITEIEMFDRV